MAKIKIGGVRYGNCNYSTMIYLVETHIENDQEVEVPLGEAGVTFPSKTEMSDVRDMIIDTAQKIMSAHKDALDKKHDIEELEFPPIT